jgi:hypothetical protein
MIGATGQFAGFSVVAGSPARDPALSYVTGDAGSSARDPAETGKKMKGNGMDYWSTVVSPIQARV